MDGHMLAAYGIDHDRGLRNCVGDEDFYKKILSMFLADDCFARARAARETGERRELFSRMHEMKGISGNAGLTELYQSVLPLVELLRGGDGGDAAQIARLFAVADEAYSRACRGISLFLAQR